MTGYVYVVRTASGRYKIGYSETPIFRTEAICRTAGEDAEALGAVPATIDQERELHRLLAPWRLYGEWYSYCPAMQPLLDGLRPMPRGAVLEALRQYRSENGISLDALGASLKLHKTTISRWERGTLPITARWAIEVEKVTGVPRASLRPDIFGEVSS